MIGKQPSKRIATAPGGHRQQHPDGPIRILMIRLRVGGAQGTAQRHQTNANEFLHIISSKII
jgi:hypothetical protein